MTSIQTKRSSCQAPICLAFALVLTACGAPPPDGKTSGPDATLSFESESEALSWLADRALEHPGARVIEDSEGVVQSILFEDDESRDALLGEFGRFGSIRVGATSYATNDEAVADPDVHVLAT